MVVCWFIVQLHQKLGIMQNFRENLHVFRTSLCTSVLPKINLSNCKLQEPFVAPCPFNKLSFCWKLQCVLPNHCTLLKMNVVAYRLEGKEMLELFFFFCSQSRLADPALCNQDSMALSDHGGDDNVRFQTGAESEGLERNAKGTSCMQRGTSEQNVMMHVC